MNVLDAPVTVFRRANEPDGRKTDATLARVLETIRTGQYAAEVAAIRAEADPVRRKALKLGTLPALAPSGRFSSRRAEGHVEHSGGFVLDFDDAPDLDALRADVNARPYVAASFVSPSGAGLKAIVPAALVDPETGEIHTPRSVAEHSACWAAVAERFETGASAGYVDPSGKDVARACYVSHDSEAYTNPDAEPVLVELTSAPPAGETTRTKTRSSDDVPLTLAEIAELHDHLAPPTPSGDYDYWISAWGNLQAFALENGHTASDARAIMERWSPAREPGDYPDDNRKLSKGTAGAYVNLLKDAGLDYKGWLRERYRRLRDEAETVHSRSSPPRGSGSGMNGAERSEPPSSGAVSIGTLSEPPAREWTVAGLIPEGAPSILAGHSGLGKSYVALYLAICVCLGRAFLGRDVRRASVLWVDRELDLDETTRRAFAVARGMGLERPPETLFYLRPLKPVGTDETQDEILDAIEQHGVGLTILDSLTLGAIGDAKEQRDVVPLMRAVEAWGTSLCIDHITKAAAAGNQSSASIFGSGMKRAIARSTFNLVPAGDALTLHPDKTNFGPASSPLHFLAKHGEDERDRPEVVFEKIEAGHEALAGAEDHAPAHEQTLYALIRLHDETGKPVPLATLAAERDVKTTTLRNHLSKLGSQIEKHGDNTYSPRSLPITAPMGSGSGVNGDASHSSGHSSPGMNGSERGDGSATAALDLAEPWDAEAPL